MQQEPVCILNHEMCIAHRHLQGLGCISVAMIHALTALPDLWMFYRGTRLRGCNALKCVYLLPNMSRLDQSYICLIRGIHYLRIISG